MNQPLKALIIEDEEIIASVLREKIKSVAHDVEIITTLTSLKTAKKWFMQNAVPDLIFMDIQLSDGVSFEIFEHYTISCPVIFTTAYDEYAIRAFKVNGVDYLLKPVDEEELKKAIIKCRAIIGNKQNFAVDMQQFIQGFSNPQSNHTAYKEKFIVNVRNQWMPVSTNDIACFAKEVLNYVYLLNGEKYIIDYSSLDELEELLDPRKFYRASRQFIINIEAVQTVKPMDNSKLVIRLKEPLHKMEIDMSRLKAPDFKKWLDR
jgi:DNA-binding LytR/AlgR family response regulator